ncbi:MAG: helicase C-terminal domain-containing protein, partial [Cyanobacteria bacterium P01_D01_bin.128]
EVHQRLRAFLREQGEPYWPHHLTMARLVARALRLGRSALLQTGSTSAYHGRHRLSYLMPALLWPGPVLLVVPDSLKHRILTIEVPRLRQWMPVIKPIQSGDRWPDDGYQGLWLTTPEQWLTDWLGSQSRYPVGVPVLVDGVDQLETWVRQALTATLQGSDWDRLMWACPSHQDLIRDVRIQLTGTLFRRPGNPYDCYLIDPREKLALKNLHQALANDIPTLEAVIPQPWQRFWSVFSQTDKLLWAALHRRQGQFSLNCSPAEVGPTLQSRWAQQPVVLMGAALDLDAQAQAYRQRLGLGDLTCLKFAPDRHQEAIQLYVPDRLPFPNTPDFQSAIMVEIHRLITQLQGGYGPTVILVNDVPLKPQIGSWLAAEFGSRVQVERTCLEDNGILITGWQFWQAHQEVLPTPHLLIVTTLPLPSLENPLVAERVTYYKRRRQDWFRLYLLPTALSELQRAIAPVRDQKGIVALLDNRVNHRSYGHQVFAALSPAARSTYIDASWLTTWG